MLNDTAAAYWESKRLIAPRFVGPRARGVALNKGFGISLNMQILFIYPTSSAE